MPRLPKRASTLARRATKFEGMNEVLDNLSNLVNSVNGQEAKDVFVRAAVECRDTIRSLTPVETGRLRQGVFAAAGDPGKSDALVGMNYKIAPHAHLVEYGHAGPHPAPPRPYFRPGLVMATDKVRQILSDGLRRIVENAGKT